MPTDSLTEFITVSPEQTFKIGQNIAKNLKPGYGHIIALNGELGSGKTCLTKGIADSLGIKETITSPTYTIVNEYLLEGSGVLYHIDTYRLNDERDFEDIGGVEILSSNNICIIEWSDKIKNLLPENVITINIEITGLETRKITIKGIEI